jgi:hypothetical protein
LVGISLTTENIDQSTKSPSLCFKFSIFTWYRPETKLSQIFLKSHHDCFCFFLSLHSRSKVTPTQCIGLWMKCC